MIDSHCHLDSEQYDTDREETIARALDAGLGAMLAIGTGNGPPDYDAAIRLADRHAAIHATVGIHPHDAAKADDRSLAELESRLSHPKVLAVGEIGLDYHYDFSPRDTQRRVFAEQLELARRARKPIVIHTREAWEDTFAILAEHWAGAETGGIMHCFSGGVEEMRRCVAMGFHISFAGVVTFPKATALHEAARQAPAERLLVETDSPYLAPAPFRGKRNEPAYVLHTARRLAELRQTSAEEIERQTDENFRRLLIASAAG